MNPQKQKLIATLVSLACSIPAYAALERVGPVNPAPSVGGYPAWYSDTTGLAMEFCAPQNAAEVAGGWCLLLPGDVPNVPETFPGSFFDEHFYWAASAQLAHGTQLRGLVTLAMESAFANGPAAAGDQITFARIRVVYTPVPVTGTYRIIHPFGEESIFAEAGSRIFFTDDVAVPCPTGFECALHGRLGPFLLPSDVPGGAEHAPLTATNPAPDTNPANFGGAFVATPYPDTGKAYIADPARIGPVTGSPLPDFVDSSGALRNHNIVRLEGPAGSDLGGPGINFIENTNFSLMGRIYTGPMPGKVSVKRASYSRSATAQQLDVVASAVESAQGRLPAQPRPAGAAPQLTFFDAPCAGTVDAAGIVHPPFSAPVGATETQMFATGDTHFGQTNPAAIPTSVCVKDGSARDVNGNLLASYTPRVVSDEVAISQAVFDPAVGSLSVAASSSDSLLPPTLSLAYGNYRGDLVNGSATLATVAPPEQVRVFSSAGGSNKLKVVTGVAPATPAPGAAPLAQADSFAFAEDAGPQVLALLANDSNVTGATVALTSVPRLGSAVVNADGSVTYTPNLNANGADGFTYTATVGTQVSNTGSVTVNIAPVNDLPVALADRASTVINVPVSVNLLANDTDPDGAADVVAAANVSAVTPAGGTLSVVGGTATFSAPVAGTYTFTYKAQDAAGALSVASPTVTVTVAAAETLAFSKAEYIRSKVELNAQGSISPAVGQTVTVEFVNSAGTVLGLAGTAIADAAGKWTLVKVVPLPTGATVLKATSSNGAVRTTPLAVK